MNLASSSNININDRDTDTAKASPSEHERTRASCKISCKIKRKRVHLVVLIHGLYGNPDNLAVLREELERAHSALYGEDADAAQASEDELSSESGSGSMSEQFQHQHPHTEVRMKSTDGVENLAQAQDYGYEYEEEEEDDYTEHSDSDNDKDDERRSLLLDHHDRKSTKPRTQACNRNRRDASTTTTIAGGGEEAEEEGDIDRKKLPSLSLKKGMDLGLSVLVPKGFCGSHTWDGIDINAQRAVKELDERIESLEDEGKQIVRISIMGYSPGGLIARYMIGILDSQSPSFFERYPPGCFSTAATPHLGVLKYGSTTNAIVHTIGRRLSSRTGRQLYCLNKEFGGRSLLEVLSDSNFGFIKGLKRFERVLIVANGCHDLTVPYPTASISLTDPFVDYPRNRVKLDVREDHTVASWSFPSSPTSQLDSSDIKVNTEEQDGDEEDIIDLPVVMRTNGKVRPRIPPVFAMMPWPVQCVSPASSSHHGHDGED